MQGEEGRRAVLACDVGSEEDARTARVHVGEAAQAVRRLEVSAVVRCSTLCA